MAVNLTECSLSAAALAAGVAEAKEAHCTQAQTDEPTPEPNAD